MNDGLDAVLIVNTRSRRGQELFTTAKGLLEADGVSLRNCWALNKPEMVIQKTRDATSSGVPLVIVGGGDGTLSSVAGSFVGSRSTLGVLPLGTGNEFARDLGIKPDVKEACKVLTSGQVAEVDVGAVAGGYFLNVATVGLTTLIAQDLRPEEKRRFGRAAYLFALVRALSQVRPFRLTVRVPGSVHSFDTLQAVVGNGRYHAGPFPLAPSATITDGELTAYVVATTSRWGLLRYALHLPGGHHVDLNEVPTFSAARIEMETVPTQRVTVDGEIKYLTPIACGVAPRALRVMAPRDSPVAIESSAQPASAGI